jgi:5-bromo-4-chloroindolyl phosphate hydrolysis protein
MKYLSFFKNNPKFKKKTKQKRTLMGIIAAVASVGRIIFPSSTGFLGYNASFIISFVISMAAAVITFLWGRWGKKQKTSIQI